MFLTATTTATADEGRMLGFDLSFLNEIWIVWLNMAIIIFILSWLLYKPIKNFLHNRRERIRAEIEDTAENLRASEEARVQYNSRLAEIHTEREEILDHARKQAGERGAEIIASANSEAGLIIDRARREIDQEREKAKDEMRSQIIQVSAMMAEQIMGGIGQMDEAKRNEILDRAITELGDVQWKN